MRSRSLQVLGLIGIMMGFFTGARLVFLLWNWNFYQSQSLLDVLAAFIYGLRFDLFTVAVFAVVPFLISAVAEVWRNPRFLRLSRPLVGGLFCLPLFPVMVITMGDSEMIGFTGRRYTIENLFFFRELPGKFWQIAGQYLPLFLISLCWISLTLYISWRWLFRSRAVSVASGGGPFSAAPVVSRSKRLIQLSVLFIAILLAARGGVQKKPLGFAHAQIFPQPMMNSLVMNSGFTLLQTLKREAAPRLRYFETREEMLSHLPGALPGPSLLEGHRPPSAQNVVLIIVESLNFDYMGAPFGGSGYTPFLDELSQKSLFFTEAYANARRSIEGMGAILAAIPALMNEPFLSSQYMSNYFLGLGTHLTKSGYHTSFFHGAQNGSMYFDSFIQSVGIQNYYGLNEYPRPEDNDGVWGIFDEPFLQWMLGKIDDFPKPFFSTVFTLTSHNPYPIPAAYKGKFPKGTLEIHESIGYTDYALRRFFEEAEKKPWYKNTLFVIVADHTFKNGRPEFQTERGAYRIPLMFFHPQYKWPSQIPTTQRVSQVDLLPSLLDFLGLPAQDRNDLTRSVFVPGDRYPVVYSDGRYTMFAQDHEIVSHKGLDFQLQKNGVQEATDENSDEVKRLKATIQYFSEGLWDNKLYYPSPGR